MPCGGWEERVSKMKSSIAGIPGPLDVWNQPV